MKRAGANMQVCNAMGRKHAAWFVAAILIVGAALGASAQEPPQAPAPAQQEQKQDSGVFASVGRWFEQGFNNLKNTFGGAKTNIDTSEAKQRMRAKRSATRRQRPGRTRRTRPRVLPTQ